MEQNAKYERAKKRVEELKEFYQHLLTYVLVNAFLVFINLRFSSGFHWFWFALFGWGLGVALHAVNTFAPGMFFGSGWEDRKIKELMDKDRGE